MERRKFLYFVLAAMLFSIMALLVLSLYAVSQKNGLVGFIGLIMFCISVVTFVLAVGYVMQFTRNQSLPKESVINLLSNMRIQKDLGQISVMTLAELLGALHEQGYTAISDTRDYRLYFGENLVVDALLAQLAKIAGEEEDYEWMIERIRNVNSTLRATEGIFGLSLEVLEE